MKQKIYIFPGRFSLLLFFILMSVAPIIKVQATGFEPRANGESNEEQLHLSDSLINSDREVIQPEFPGGESGLHLFVGNNSRYPSFASENGIQGRVILSFIVEKDGLVSNLETMRSPAEALNKEAMRITTLMPRWNPGTINGEVAPMKVILAYSFRLPEKVITVEMNPKPRNSSHALNTETKNLVGRIYNNDHVDNVATVVIDGVNFLLQSKMNMKADAVKAAMQKQVMSDKDKDDTGEKTEIRKAEQERIRNENNRVNDDYVKKAIIARVNVNFKTENKLVLTKFFSVDETPLKEAGWDSQTRKSFKNRMPHSHSKEKFTYKVVGSRILLENSNKRDTLRISSDGRFLYGKINNLEYKLTRIK
ncbi:MAG: energy transducer TonB [Bacteroidales bacterium]|nr:energy transducer TonB [Bacteroidales bacterium]